MEEGTRSKQARPLAHTLSSLQVGINGAIKTKELLRSYCAPARGGRGEHEHRGDESAFHVHAIKGDKGERTIHVCNSILW